MLTRSSDDNSVCQMRALWQNGRKVSPDFYTRERSFSQVFWEEEWLVRSDHLYLKFWVNRPADFEPIIARSTSAVRPSEKSSIYTKRKSPMRFPTSPRWSSYVAPKSPKGVQKRKTADFRPKSHFTWRKPATKLLCVKTVSDKVVRHSLA